ncbi:hypothetical protein MPTK1_3g14470 [Marchantia polymorpha subsp. ruderalis]|uniref:Protein kinase domain-containing protein n=2 Tax=Marchantia polymorpha TaxID=3197 RepID=A0A176VM05_MARPO|nr:hypothetical protein AXG93_4382s1100 [Marchantia polymorpha subsp. ruderalis]PTQ48981.1 hypothetical protein MARPO_0004s0224 [Marchantia polymorpha]BBN05601.1 hypothetical protein Mp_3g14470 [Marchantia polymorpha subsp. ruderalis]|eukprot:PTQ48981.1 hypothetical protein MARPO_0004s0224 [Marchantia polymorpha]
MKRGHNSDDAEGGREDEEEKRTKGDGPSLNVKILNSEEEMSNHYKQLDLIGEGCFGQTFIAHPANNPRIRFAMKVQTKENPYAPAAFGNDGAYADVLRLYREIVILTKILPRHRNIIQVKDTLIGPDNLYILTELCTQYTLEDFFPKADAVTGKRIFRQLADALLCIHQHGVVHWDLNLFNILFVDENLEECKIIDFGLSAYHPSWATKTNNNFDPRAWFREEELDLPMGPNKSGDIKCLGYFLHCILAGKFCPVMIANMDVEMTTTYRPRSELFGQEAMNLLKMIGPRPFGPERVEELPPIETICQHPWLTR